jgi:hypothetical protein
VKLPDEVKGTIVSEEENEKEKDEMIEDFHANKDCAGALRELADKLERDEELAVMAISTVDLENRAGELFWLNRDYVTDDLIDELCYRVKTELFELLSDENVERTN